ncbi:MAG: alpha/beta fold hydrolase [Rhodocyclaceae bacterium]|jgi:triacylglycerol lipase|nr:alpha/beta fold hydrolase [Rhodocyclaceae bacterium]
MTASTLHRLMLAGEFVFYLLLGLGLTARCGWVWQQAVGLALILMVAGRAFIIGVTFAFARAYVAPPPEGCRIGSARGLMMYLRELSAFFLLFTLVMPFERFLMGADRLGRAGNGRLPLLLIHGYQCNRGYWIQMRGRLERAGWQVATLSLNPVFNDIDGYVEPLARRIEEVLAATGAERLILVGHSMGGLVSRAYLRRHGAARVAKLITLGSPHKGSMLAKLGLGENGRQMVPGSQWLKELNAPGAVPLPPTVSLYSCQDNYVMPQDSSLLEGAKVVPLAGIGHLEMAFSPEIERRLLAELAEN